MKKYYITFILICIQILTFSQVNNLGIPLMTNYTSDDFMAGPQIWDIEQDKNGILYFGNEKGILEFDGKNWQKYNNINKATVRKLYIDNKNNVFVGMKNDFGFLDVDEHGNKFYKSLTYLMSDTIKDFGEVLGIGKFNNKIAFIAGSYFFVYDYDTIKVFNGKYRNRISHTDGNNFYTFSLKYGLLKLMEDTVIQVKNSDFFKSVGVIKIIRKNDHQLYVFTLIDDTYLFEEKDSTFTKLNLPIKDFLIKSYIFEVQYVENKYFVFGTFYNGVVITDINFNIITTINQEAGLANNSVFSLFKDFDNNIWAGTQNGISFLEISTPLSLIDKRKGAPEVITATYSDDKYIYFGSVTGIYYLDKTKKDFRFNQIKCSIGQIWDFTLINNKIFMSDLEGIQIVKDSSVSKNIDEKVKVTSWTLKQYKKQSELYISGTNQALIFYELKNNELIFKNIIEGYEKNARWFGTDKEGYIWVSDKEKGIYKLTLDTEYKKVIKQDLYDTLKGLPSNLLNHFWQKEDDIFVGTEKGIYKYNKAKDMFETFANVNKQINQDAVWYLNFDFKDNIWFVGQKHFGAFKKLSDNSYKLDSVPFKRFEASMIQHFFYYNEDTIMYFFPNFGLIFTDNVSKNYKPKLNCIIRKIEFLNTEDSIKTLFGGFYKNSDSMFVAQVGKPPRLEYSKNSLRFSYSAPIFEANNKIQFSLYLEGYEKKWNEWSNVTFKEYSNLKEGEYVFHLKARNVYGFETKEVSYKFSVMPPWYRTWLAIISFIILGILIILLIIKLYVRRLLKQQEKLEQIILERTAEIRQQKEEISAQNENLLQQKEEILVQNENLLQQREEIMAQSETLEAYANELEKLSIVASETDSAVMVINEKGDFEWINEGFTRLYGYNFEEFVKILGKNIFEVSSNHDINLILDKCRNEKVSVIYESQTQAKNGEVIWVQTTLTPILSVLGDITKFIAIDSDIRKMKEAEIEITKQKNELKEKNDHITSSINYAQTIQTAILPVQENIDNQFENFIIFRPKDIVSGDFYWYSEIEKYIYIASLDCTGHGVPGAFMSMIGNTLLNEIVNSKRILETNNILTKLDELIKISLRQENSSNTDGMDVCFCRIEKTENSTIVNFTGAKRPLLVYKQGDIEIESIKGSRKSIGGNLRKRNIEDFSVQEIVFENMGIIYLSTDGFCDQNDVERKKYGSVQLCNLLINNIDKPMNEQRIILEESLDNWMSGEKQRDDISMIGIKLNK